MPKRKARASTWQFLVIAVNGVLPIAVLPIAVLPYLYLLRRLPHGTLVPLTVLEKLRVKNLLTIMRHLQSTRSFIQRVRKGCEPAASAWPMAVTKLLRLCLTTVRTEVIG